MQFVEESAVVTARQFNPTILNQLWLVRNELAQPDDFDGSAVLTPAFANLTTSQFELLMTPDRMQIRPVTSEELRGAVVQRVLGGIVLLLRHTPFTGAGLNFNFDFPITGPNPNKLTRRMFCRDDGPLSSEFNSEDAFFGAYCSKDIFGCRMKLRILPMGPTKPLATEHKLRMECNYHFGPDDIDAERINNFLCVWDQVRHRAIEICTRVEKWEAKS